MATVWAADPIEAVSGDPTKQEAAKLALHVTGVRRRARGQELGQKCFQVLLHDPVQGRVLWAPRTVFGRQRGPGSAEGALVDHLGSRVDWWRHGVGGDAWDMPQQPYVAAVARLASDVEMLALRCWRLRGRDSPTLGDGQPDAMDGYRMPWTDTGRREGLDPNRCKSA